MGNSFRERNSEMNKSSKRVMLQKMNQNMRKKVLENATDILDLPVVECEDENDFEQKIDSKIEDKGIRNTEIVMQRPNDMA